ncbi:hypothetical protein PCAR4_290013 [Paraburkholderia caribensis]|nr:hypothetical protein PCAR4_290013 [Paraburkholderia caribensis]
MVGWSGYAMPKVLWAHIFAAWLISVIG